MKLKMPSFFVIFDRIFIKQRRNEGFLISTRERKHQMFFVIQILLPLINFLRADTKLQPLEELLYHQPNSEFLSVEGQ